MERRGFHWTNFHEIWYLSIFWKSVQKIQVSLKSDTNKYFTWRPIHIYISSSFFLVWEMFQTVVVDKIKTHVLCLIAFFFGENHAVYEIMLQNIVESDRPQIILWCMRIACWITKATNSHCEYYIIIAFPLPQWLRECASMLRYTYTVCFVISTHTHKTVQDIPSSRMY